MTFSPPNPWELYRQVAPLWRQAGARPLDQVEVLLTMLAIAKHQHGETNPLFDLRQGELIQPLWEEMHRRLADALGLPFDENSIDEIAARTPGLLEQTRRALSPAFSMFSDDAVRAVSHELLIPFMPAAQTGIRDPSVGYFMWPPYLAPLLISLLGRPSKKDAIYCPFDSSGLLAAVLADSGWNVHCELTNHQTARILVLFAFVGDWHLDVRVGDPVRTPQWVDNQGLIYFKRTAAITTFGSRYKDELFADRYGRFPVRSYYGETMQIAHMMAQTDGRLVCIVPESFLFRTAGGERDYKEQLVRRGVLSCVIRLPREVFAPSTNVQSSIVIFDTVPSRASDVLFVDAAKYFSREELSVDAGPGIDDAVKEVASIVRDRSPGQNSVLANRGDIAAEDFNISVGRYVIDPALRKQRQILARQQTFPLGDLVEIYRPQARPLATPVNLEDERITALEVATGDVHDGIVGRPERSTEVSVLQLRHVERAVLRPDDILISIKGKVGAVGLVPAEVVARKSEAWIAGQAFVIARLRRSTAIISPAVLVAYLASPFGQAQLQALSGGVTVPLIQMSDLKRLPIPLPSPAMQKQITHEFKQIEDLRERIRAIEGEIEERGKNLSKLFVSQND